MVEVPSWWLWASGVYFFLSILWSIALCLGLWMILKKVLPVIKEAQVQVRRVSGQAKSIAARASSTADIVHAQTQHLLGNAQSTGSQVTRQARTVGAALTGLLVASRVINFVRKII